MDIPNEEEVQTKLEMRDEGAGSDQMFDIPSED